MGDNFKGLSSSVMSEGNTMVEFSTYPSQYRHFYFIYKVEIKIVSRK